MEEASSGKIFQAIQPRRLDEAKFTMIWPPKDFNSSYDNDFLK